MTCMWCSNPESQDGTPELLFYENKCCGCGACVSACTEEAIKFENGRIKQDFELCVSCGQCVKNCYYEARKIMGNYMDADEVFAKVDRDKLFYKNSGGGVTFSGGEPLLYPNLIAEVADKCHEEGYTVYAETCGCFPSKNIDMIIGKIDKLLYDIKIMDEDLHRHYCGVTNLKILANFRYLCGKIDIQPRIPIIPGVNDSDENINAISEFLKSCSIDFPIVHILPYHILGQGKYPAMGLEYQLPDVPQLEPGDPVLERVKGLFEEQGIEVKIGG